MTTARSIIQAAMSFRLNRLSPGETMDADDGSRALDALNVVADDWNGRKTFLFRDLLTAGTVSGVTGTLGSTWSALSPGDEILGAAVSYTAGSDIIISPITMQQYLQIPVKATLGLPQVWAHDGLATVYFYPGGSGQTVTLRTKQPVQTFADLDTDYSMPAGYRAALMDCVAEMIAPLMAPSMVQVAAQWAKAARQRIGSQVIEPGMLPGRPVGGNILNGWS